MQLAVRTPDVWHHLCEQFGLRAGSSTNCWRNGRRAAKWEQCLQRRRRRRR